MGSSIINGNMAAAQEDRAILAEQEVERLRSALDLAIGLGRELGLTEIEVEAIKARAVGEAARSNLFSTQTTWPRP